MTSYPKTTNFNTLHEFKQQDKLLSSKDITLQLDAFVQADSTQTDAVNTLTTALNTATNNVTNLQDKTTNITQTAGITSITGVLNTKTCDVGLSNNIIIGNNSGAKLTTGTLNCIYGLNTATELSTGSKNTHIGSDNAFSATSAAQTYATSIGYQTSAINDSSTCVGSQSHASTSGTSIGRLAGNGGWSQGVNNTCIGNESGVGYLSNQQNRIWLGNSSVSHLYCNVQSISALSDQRDKVDVNPIENTIDCTAYINTLEPKTYRMNPRQRYKELKEGADNIPYTETFVNDGSRADTEIKVGLIAQHVRAIEDSQAIPNPIVYDNMSDEHLSVAYTTLVPILIQALKESNMRIDELEERIEALE